MHALDRTNATLGKERAGSREQDDAFSTLADPQDDAPRLPTRRQVRQHAFQGRGQALGRQTRPRLDQSGRAGNPTVLDGIIPGAYAPRVADPDAADAPR